MTIEPGARLLHYELVEKLGEGGMGVVWKAIDTTLDRPVAVKLLPPAFSETPERLARFEREAKLLATLNHPNIAAIFSVHRAEGQHFIALELVEGEDLATRTAAGPLLLEDALQVCLEIAQALEAAHASGVIHRDLKPANVKLGADGKVKVLDFGLAKAIETPVASDTSPTFAPTVTSAGTRDGVILGTAAYMSPEQARGKPADQRADLWSFGCVLYECLTGQVLFRGETVSDSLAAILRKEPDWDRLPAETPVNVRTLLRRCLTRDPDRRLHSASDARIELLEAIEHPETAPATATTARPAPRKRLGTALLLIVLGLAAGWGLGALLGGSGERVREIAHVGIPVPPSLRMALAPELTPDGKTVVFAALDHDAGYEERSYRLFVRRLDGDEVIRVDGSENSQNRITLSPDGRSIAFVANPSRLARPDLFRVPVDLSAPPQRLTEWNDDLSEPIWINDGTLVATRARDQVIFRYPATGGPAGAAIAITGDPAPLVGGARSALPDGRHVLVQAVTFETGVYQQYIGVVDSETGAFKRLLDHGSRPRYMPPGFLVFSRADQLLVVPFDADRLVITGSPQTLIGRLWAPGGYTGGSFAVSASGDLVYYTGGVQGGNRRLVFSDREGELTPWADYRQEFNFVLVSPDGKYLATMVDNTTEGDDLLLIRASRIDRPRLLTVGTQPGMDCSNFLWSTDSRLIAYGCSGQTTTVIYVTDPAGAGSTRKLVEYPADIGASLVGFTADNSHVLALRTGAQGRRELVSIAVDGGDPASNMVLVTTDDEPGPNPQASRDGRWLSYFTTDTGRRELYVREILDDHTLGPRRSVGIEAELAWWSHVHRNDTYELLFIRDRRMYAVDLKMSPALQPGEPRRIEIDLHKAGLIFTESVPDGRLLHIQQPDSEYGSSEMRLILNWRAEVERRF